jgi:hypothetical protein
MAEPLTRPDLVRNLAFVAGVFHRDGWLDAADLAPVRCPVLVEKPRLCALIIADFLEGEKPDTFAPIRRSHPERGQHALEVDPD